MIKFVQKANLPENVGTVLIGEKYLNIFIEKLSALDISVISIPDNDKIGKVVSGHADMSVFHAGGECIFLAPQLKGTGVHRVLSDAGMRILFAHKNQGELYPEDVILNTCAVGQNVIVSKYTDASIVEYFTIAGRNIIKVKQGYSKCSVIVVDEKSIITADRGIALAAKNAAMDVLFIRPGFVDLPGFDYGFIGGAAFKISTDMIAFTGLLDDHPDKKEIFDFLSLHNVEPLFLTDNTVFDIGGAIPVFEKN